MSRRAFASPVVLALASALALVAPDVRPDAPAPAPAVAPSPAAARVPELDAAAHAIASERTFQGAAVGIAVVDVETGQLLAGVNEHLALNPASNAKLYTAAAALATLHGDHRYVTALAGKLDGDRVDGPLALRGFGDPSLTTQDLWAMVQELERYGVKRVDGDIVVDQRFYDDQTTPPAFEQQPNEWAAFRAPVSAVALDENCITMTVRPGPAGGAARVSFDPPGFVDVDGTVKTGDPGGADDVTLALAGNGPRMTAHVSGAIGGDSRLVRYTRRAEDPRLLAGYALAALLRKDGVAFGGQVKLGSGGSGHVLARHESAPLSQLLYALGKRSDNFYAEMIFKTLGGEARGRPARSAEAAQFVTQWLSSIGITEPGLVIKNGSGLFDANRVSPWSTAELLRWAWRDPEVQPEYVAQLSVGGVDGTLHKRFRQQGVRRHVRAKTGTLNDVIALSGYALRDDGRAPVAFSILFNRVAGKQSGARIAADRLVEQIVRWAERGR